MLYANDFAPRDGVLRLHLICNDPAIMKGDGYAVTLDGEVFLIDGGMKGDVSSYAYLLRLREAWLRQAPPKAKAAPLRLHWIVSHFHTDHVDSPLSTTLRDRRFALDRVYLPPRTALDESLPHNCEKRYRKAVQDLINLHHPSATVITSAFGGDSLTIALGESSITLMPPDRDWGVGADREAMQTLWEMQDNRIGVGVINAGSQWVLFRHGGRAVLFTGDTMKRTAECDAEPFDTMLARWKDEIGVCDIVKWPHHGYVRDHAASGVMSLSPRYVFFNHHHATAEDVVPHGVTTINHGKRTRVIEVALDGGIKVL